MRAGGGSHFNTFINPNEGYHSLRVIQEVLEFDDSHQARVTYHTGKSRKQFWKHFKPYRSTVPGVK